MKILSEYKETMGRKQTKTETKTREKMTLSEQAIRRLFPCEKFRIEEEGVYVALSRIPKSKELIQAKLLAKSGYDVYLVPENDKSKKNFDAIVDGRETEFKTVTGSLLRVSDNFGKGIKQGKDVFLKIEQPFSLEEVRKTIVGKLKVLKLHNALKKETLDGYVYVYIPGMDIPCKWNIKSMVDIK